MIRGTCAFLIAVPMLLSAAPSAWPETARQGIGPDLGQAIGWSQRLGARLPVQELVTDESGVRRPFGTLLSAKPIILSFAYYRCPNLCTLVLNGLADALAKIKEKPGADYGLVTLSIDSRPEEGSRLALMKQRTYLARLGATRESVWKFLTADRGAIERITRAAGFRFHFDQASQEYFHPSGILILSPDGVIRQYLMGIRFDPAELSLALERASHFRSGSLVEQLLLFCIHYDPGSSRMGARILLAVRWLGAFFALAFAAALIIAFRRERKA